MRVLLDTHVLLWSFKAPAHLAADARAALESPVNDVFVSAVSPWEVEIKRAAGKLEAPTNLLAEIDRAGFAPLPISLEHGAAAGRLPLHHEDPFDRLLVAQAQVEGLTIVTRDPVFERYQVAIMVA